jgi:hypothetical protein
MMRTAGVRRPGSDWPRWLEPVALLVACSLVALYFGLCLWGPLP